MFSSLEYLGYIAILAFSVLFTFLFIYSKTHKIKSAVIACLFVIKFIALLAWTFGLDRTIFTLIVVHRGTGIEVLHVDFTANMIAFLTSLQFTTYIFLAPHIAKELPASWRSIVYPGWMRE